MPAGESRIARSGAARSAVSARPTRTSTTRPICSVRPTHSPIRLSVRDNMPAAPWMHWRCSPPARPSRRSPKRQSSPSREPTKPLVSRNNPASVLQHHRSLLMRLFTAAALAFLLSVPAGAATMHEYGGLALSAAGDRVASLESDAVADSTKRTHSRIVVRSVANGRVLATIDPCADCDYSNLTFAPDGRLAFIERSKGKKDGTQLMLAGAGAPVKVATIHGIAQEPRFSPDGRRIALLVTIGARKEAGATQAGIRQVGEIGETNDEQRIAVVPTSGGTITPVSPADGYVYEYDWTPDGTGLVVTSALGNGDN